MGATFAYFSLTSSVAGNTKTDIEGQVGEQTELPSITMSGTKSLVLNVSDAQMSQNTEAYGKYYAVVNSNGNEPSVKNSAQNHEIAKVEIDKAQTGYTYTCTAKFKITTSGTIFGELENGSLQDSDGALVITGEAEKVLIDSAATKTFDIASLKAMKEGSEGTFTVTFKGLSSTDTSRSLKADMYINNATDRSQNYLASKGLTVSVAGESFSCDTDVKAD